MPGALKDVGIMVPVEPVRAVRQRALRAVQLLCRESAFSPLGEGRLRLRLAHGGGGRGLRVHGVTQR